MMNRFQFLLTKLAEEGAEIAQIGLKTQQFGENERYPNQPFNNAERTHQELDDLVAIVEMLNDEFQFGYVSSRERVEAKKAKVNKYYEFSKRLGMVQDEEKESSISQ